MTTTTTTIMAIVCILGLLASLMWYLKGKQVEVLEQDLTDSQRLIDSLTEKIAVLEGRPSADGSASLRISLPNMDAVILSSIYHKKKNLSKVLPKEGNYNLMNAVDAAVRKLHEVNAAVDNGEKSLNDAYLMTVEVAATVVNMIENFNELEVNNGK
jgi:hypothetical protein